MAAHDLKTHGGLRVGRAGLESAAARIQSVRTEAGFGRGARDFPIEFLRITTRWLGFIGHLQNPSDAPRPYAALLDDFVQWMANERGLSPATLDNRRWHVGKFLDWFYKLDRRISDLKLQDLDAYIESLHAKRLSRVTIKIHTNAIRAFIRHAEQRAWCSVGIADALHGPHIYRYHELPLGPSWDDVRKLIDDAASNDPVDVRDQAILLLFTIYGLRAGEVAILRLEDIDWEHDRLTVRRSKQGRS